MVFSHDVLRANESFGLIFRPRHTPSNNTRFFIPDCQPSVSEKYADGRYSAVSRGVKRVMLRALYFTLNNENPLKGIIKIKKKNSYIITVRLVVFVNKQQIQRAISCTISILNFLVNTLRAIFTKLFFS